MVNFNVRLRDNQYTEWRQDYLDYKRLKKALKKQQHVDSQLTQHALLSNSAIEEQMNEDTNDQNHLIQPLLHKLFVSRRKDHRINITPSTSSSELQSLIFAPVEFESMLENQLDKVENAYQRHLTLLHDQFQLLRQQYRQDAPQATQESIKNTLIELHRMLHQLNNFALLNYTGFIKILKKHDKKFPTQISLTKQYHPRLQHYSFTEAKQVRLVLTQLEQMYADAYCDGNRSVAIATLMTRKEDFVDWNHVYMGIKIGSCLILLVWVLWDSVIIPTFKSEQERHVIDLARTRAYPVYRAIGCWLLLHWLLGLSLYVWHSARINYRYIFELDPRTTPHYTTLFSDATNMTIVYLVNVLLYYKVVNGYFPEQLLHRGYYPLGLFLYAIYYYIIRPWTQQKGLVWTVVEVIGAPFFPVTFLHVFVGDYLTSTVKVNQDMAWSVCFFFTKEFLHKDEVEMDSNETSCAHRFFYTNIAVPLICALPLWWRFLQSLRRIYDTETWWPNLPNAFKYALAQVVVLFSIFHPFYKPHLQVPALDATIHFGSFHIIWITLFTLSSLYTWIWDVWMDWGLGRPEYKFLGDRQMFSRIWVYYVAIVADFFLRFAWMLTLIPPHTSSSLPLYLQPFTMVLELFRRTFWGFFRLENEHLRNTQGFRRVDFIPLHYEHDVGRDTKKKLTGKDKPLVAKVLFIKIFLILLLVLGLSLLAILVER